MGGDILPGFNKNLLLDFTKEFYNTLVLNKRAGNKIIEIEEKRNVL